MSRLERITYICLIALCAVSVAAIGHAKWSAYKAQQTPSLPPQAALGKKLEIPGVAWNPSHLSAVVYLSTRCHFCDESMPFYRRLAEQHQKDPSRIPDFLAISPEAPAQVEEHLRDNHVTFDQVYQIGLPHSFLRGTPTLLIVDGDGVVRRVDVGKLSAIKEEEIIQLFKTGRI